MQFTKGEWEAKKSPMGDWVIFKDGDCVELICREVRHFNVSIIKTAPIMYEALKMLLAGIKVDEESFLGWYGNPIPSSKAIKAGLTALAKVEEMK